MTEFATKLQHCQPAVFDHGTGYDTVTLSIACLKPSNWLWHCDTVNRLS